MPLRYVIKVSDDVWGELHRLKAELGLESPNQVIRELIKAFRGRVTPSADGVTPSTPHGVTLSPLDGVTPCKARRASGKTWIVECADGRKAFVPEESLKALTERFGDAVELLD